MEWPSVADVARKLREVHSCFDPSTGSYADPADDDAFVEVRLQVYPDGQWAIREGDPSFDTDHHGFWGAGSVPAWNEPFESHEMAAELLYQAMEHYAQVRDLFAKVATGN